MKNLQRENTPRSGREMETKQTEIAMGYCIKRPKMWENDGEKEQQIEEIGDW